MIPKYFENNINYIKLNFDYIVGSQKATSLKTPTPCPFSHLQKKYKNSPFKMPQKSLDMIPGSSIGYLP